MHLLRRENDSFFVRDDKDAALPSSSSFVWACRDGGRFGFR